ncbi:MAG TPA: amino acid permease [Rhizomicrobium sp.]|jgi:cation diffusion facilitator CzcD-associated flavoprotein CzcO/amino acid transporter|nr:amino acid permease [Rhizomicrobium sp.]
MDDVIRAAARQFERGRRRNTLSTSRIVFLVVAAAAPLAAMIGNLPIALGRGNGAGVPAAFLLAAVTLLCFAVGYAAMSRRIVNTGAFYTYIAHGLGKPAGVGGAFIALVAYITFTVGMAGACAYYFHLVLTPQQSGEWVAYAVVAIAVTGVLGYRSIDLSSKVLGVLMTAEIAVLAVFDICVLWAKGFGAFPLESFTPSVAFAPGFAVALMFAYTSFIGFESAALYGEEAKEPTKSIPTATYASVFLIGGFYLLTAWITVGAIGALNAKPLAQAKGGQLMLDMITQYSGAAAMAVAAILLCTSLLASYLAIHNAATRYVFALSREKLLPEALGRFHPKRYAPSNASLVVSAITVVGVGSFLLSGLDPYLTLIPLLIGFGTLGIIALQAFAAVAILVYFRRRNSPDVWRTLAAPAVGAVGLIAATALVAWNFGLLATIEAAWVNWLPLAYVVACAAGVAFALWLKQAKPKNYLLLAAADTRADATREISKDVVYPLPHCIVGAGPCGLLAARAFKLAGIPYEQFERHSDVGGIWDIDNPGSSMYESAHFISSKYTSGFFGFPMPEAYPDYPDHTQLLAYIRSFAEKYRLKDSVRFNTSVVHAEPINSGKDGWDVTLSTGEKKRYAGVVVANGVTWHPNLPAYPGLDRFKGEVRHTVTHRSADSFKRRRVLIVGAGNSGVDIACDAARSAEAAFISVRRGYRFVPKHIFGVPTDMFLSGMVRPPKGVVLPDDPSKMLDALTGDLTRYGLPAPDHKALESHPIMNNQILHHLGHGDLIAKRDVKEFTEDGAIFADGSREAFDLVLFATGYEYKIPFLDEKLLTWKQGHPQFYLNIFHRTLQGLSAVGYVEFASAGYQRFDEMAQMAAMDAYVRASGLGTEEWARMKAEDHPNLRGKMNYIDSPRHANYVDVDVYRRKLAEVREQFGWPDPSHTSYNALID